MLISFLTKIFGIYFGLRIFESFFRKNNIPKQELTKIVSIFMIIQATNLFFVSNTQWQLAIIFIPIFIFILMEKIYLKWLENQFQSLFPDIMTNIILHMKMGKSFRVALALATESAPQKFQFQMGRIYELVVFSPQDNDKKMAVRSAFIHQIVVQFIKIDRSSLKSVEKLESFRRKLVIVNQFRRKSGQIRGQVRLQSNILLLLYGLCFAFVFWSFPLNELQSLLFCSILLFIIGQFLVFWIGRRICWKI